MDKTYDPHAIEQRWYQTWEDRGWFEPGTGDGKPYCIMIPPPTSPATCTWGMASTTR